MSAIPPRPYVQLHSYRSDIKPPPCRRNISRYDLKPQRTICCRCVCCCCCSLFLIILLSAAFVYYIYAFCNPQSPIYEFFDLQVKSFDIQKENSLKAELSFAVRYENPNKDIEFIYCEESRVVVIYNTTAICSGKLPAFHQGGNNVTVVRVVLKGVSHFGSGLQEAMGENQRDGMIPLSFKVTAAVRFVVLGVETKQIVVLINGDLTVDNLLPNKKVNVVSSEYDAVFDV